MPHWLCKNIGYYGHMMLKTMAGFGHVCTPWSLLGPLMTPMPLRPVKWSAVNIWILENN